MFCVYDMMNVINHVVHCAYSSSSNMLFPGVNNCLACLFFPVTVNNSTSNTSSVAYTSSQYVQPRSRVSPFHFLEIFLEPSDLLQSGLVSLQACCMAITLYFSFPIILDMLFDSLLCMISYDPMFLNSVSSSYLLYPLFWGFTCLSCFLKDDT